MNGSSSVLDQIIKTHNPFDKTFVVRTQDIWNKGFPDVPSLNAHASDAIFEAIEKVRSKQRQVIGITITAEKGLGKSHLISRIRQHLQSDGNALFVYMSEYGELNRIKVEFLRNLASSLKQIGSQGVSQWRELATDLFNEALNYNYTPEFMVSRFAEAYAKNSKVVEHLRDRVITIKPDIDPEIITAIIWTLSSEQSDEAFAVNWLAGKSLPQSKADAMCLSNPSTEDKEAESFTTARQILDLISDYKPIVICFDELESEARSEAGFNKAQVSAIFAKDLYDKIKSGIILTAMYPETWNHYVKVLPHAEAVVDRIGEKIIDLRYLNSDDVVALVSYWLNDFYQANGVQAPYQVYPFNEDKLRQLGKEKLIVRRVLQWCKENFKPSETHLKHPVEDAYHKELIALETTINDYMEEKQTLADALWLTFSAIKAQKLENVEIQDIVKIKTKAVDKGYLDFKIIGQENGKAVKIGVAVLQESGGMFVQATLRRLIDYKKFDLTRGCLVRSKQISSKAARAQQYLHQLLSPSLGGEWVLLKSEYIKPLLAILFVWNAHNDYELTEEQIFDFIRYKQIATGNYLIREILSDPSGQIPQDAIDEESTSDNVKLSKQAMKSDMVVESLFN